MKNAYAFGEQAHAGQFRKSGEPYFIHPAEVTLILAELEMDQDTLISGLLHDVIEDTDYTFDQIAERFGTTVAQLVDGVTKLGKIHYETKEEFEAENLRKMFLAMAEDIRVILIKLADRLHNIRTLKFMTDDKKREKARETLEIYAPIAHRLGIFKIKWELEDLSLLYIDPEGYYDLVAKVNKKRSEREAYITDVIDSLKRELGEVDIRAEIYGRPKNFYSIYKKMVYQHKNFNEIFDITAVRVIVDSVKDCYGVLGIVHTLWKPIPGRFKDYIAMPKQNMYQSLHTTVISGIGDPFEIQIRTAEMHRIAEYGIAAHWKYKEGDENSVTNIDDKLAWLRQMMEVQKDIESPEEFMDTLKFDLFSNQVYVFTPQGKVVELPTGSTPVDFAYKIHSAVGNRCIGAKVDGRIVPLNFVLENGKIVEIITSKTASGPSRDWLKFVKSSEAKNKIKHWFKKERREENVEKGKEMLEREIRRNGFQFKDFLKSEWQEIILKRLTVKSLEDLYASVGYGGILTGQVIPKLRELYREEEKKKRENQSVSLEEHDFKKVNKKEPKGNQGIIVEGIENTIVRFAKCCSPVPGDRIIGYITRGRGVTVHQMDCSNLETNEEARNRYIEVSWAKDEVVSYNSEVQIVAPDRKGLLSEITMLMAETRVTVNGVNARRTKDGIALINLNLEIQNTEQLTKIINKFKSMPEVIDVKRVTG
ncbi:MULTISPECIES: bifunctional (p)ppGpp synthetase/guanosine-3',5'-bis(diphosphate) 3'-pyrophosphohydrolase [unclassified Fusibacter]|uniref:RelA/SpoT family protein n=1 Tax=unclassified Fusibacter TaxID=2624464 RepID=UPI001012F81C|nr:MULTISPECIES: bifunctional (p)ppGpp synthetase/guanosine-3',5'-bis(diphosphate) 3'-pyrophosphohydrolase [unclassified Fusibacter]MCK8059033.1 bifunctional (p)ppGpp synthetase/guanosine-3',5'-bis(diphosphate) 3'-pyrophosphohydrolase [Fusibacter sp. A2]NPE22444.1 bifunctional (p)ppGpp synthetase/guanosine-3',5'-bis(diphosphate) 3'-pyrophosphohydrolase [Fusibacter sp. A1]RXV60712.1 bifunctional (p)ppGpp synthetase/guanosine-3',5'-bis(diphosphate) 3'-pyrophosphohydrolase [Fusibacter sp. A1]